MAYVFGRFWPPILAIVSTLLVAFSVLVIRNPETIAATGGIVAALAAVTGAVHRAK